MKKHRRLFVAALLLAAVAVLFLSRPSELTFRGKPETYWITNIVYNGTDDQTKQWLGFGAEGVQLLIPFLIENR